MADVGLTNQKVAMERIRISTHDDSDAITTVRVDGVIDTITATEVDRAVMGATRRGRHRLVIDLAGVDYISSAGWGVFIAHLKETREQSGDVRLCGMIPNVREIYELMEFDTVLSAFPNTTQALQSFHTQGAAPNGGPRQPVRNGTAFSLEELGGIGPESAPNNSLAPAPRLGAGSDSEQALLSLVQQDPFASIAELRDSLNEELRDSHHGWWSVFTLLRKHGLLRKRARFRLAKGTVGRR